VQLEELILRAPAIQSPHRIVASWDGALIDQLPVGPVDELRLTAAFHDPNAEAIRQLLARMRPKNLHLAVQARRTVINPAALDRILKAHQQQHKMEVVVHNDSMTSKDGRERYRHGKLIEWATDDGNAWSLTGSPNLSVAALLGTPSEGHNHELAILGPSPGTRFPSGEIISLKDVPAHQISSINEDDLLDAAHEQVRIVGAIAQGDQLEVYL